MVDNLGSNRSFTTTSYKVMRIHDFIFRLGTYLAIGLIFAYVSLYSFEKAPIKYANLPFPTDRSQYYQGESVYLSVNVCADDHLTYQFAHNFENVETGAIVLLQENSYTTKEGCEFVTGAERKISEAVTPGKWKVVGMAKSKGKLKTHETPFESEVFEVLPPPPNESLIRTKRFNATDTRTERQPTNVYSNPTKDTSK